ncbi:MAG: hypothetical protein ACI9WC_000237 [Arenicella sp.]
MQSKTGFKKAVVVTLTIAFILGAARLLLQGFLTDSKGETAGDAKTQESEIIVAPATQKIEL